MDIKTWVLVACALVLAMAADWPPDLPRIKDIPSSAPEVKAQKAAQRDGAAGQPLRATLLASAAAGGMRKEKAPDFRAQAANIGMDQYVLASLPGKRRYLMTAGVDGCMAVLIPNPDAKAAALFHFHFNRFPEADRLIKDALREMGDPGPGTQAFLIGGYPRMSEKMLEHLKNGFAGKNVALAPLADEVLKPCIRTVIYDLARSELQVDGFSVSQTTEPVCGLHTYKIHR